ncbi:hypothetical protein [Nevskia ramosa]|uniref:hypothetical protein n=1 Tax=Nevskia ramosa TaxID=64002 RepID=UPI003D097DA5
MRSLNLKVVLYGAGIYVLLSLALGLALGAVAFGFAFAVLGLIGIGGVSVATATSQSILVIGAGYAAGRLTTKKAASTPLNHVLVVGLLAATFEALRSLSAGALIAALIAVSALCAVLAGGFYGKRALA